MKPIPFNPAVDMAPIPFDGKHLESLISSAKNIADKGILA
jgi:hypothetical protein